MAKQTINLGAAPNDNTGDSVRDFTDKINDNFGEIYGVVGLLKSDGTDTLSAAVPVTDYMPAYDLSNNFYDWGPGVLYEVGDMVYWSNLEAEYFYICKTAHTSTGTDPTTNDRANWILIYAIPDLANISDSTGILAGIPAKLVDFFPLYDISTATAWVTGTPYLAEEIVYHDYTGYRTYFMCKTGHTSGGTDPLNTDSANWKGLFRYSTDYQATMTKATSGDINTGTDDAKYVTSAGIAGSNVAMKLSINNQTGTTYTLALADNGKLVTFGNANPIAVTVPTNASIAFPVGAQIDCTQILAGKVTFAGEDGTVTINSKGGLKSIGAQWVGVTLIQIAANSWLLVGDLIA